MCLMVFLGTDRKVKGFDDVALGQIGIDPAPRLRPRALSSKRLVYGVADRVPTGWNCSCIFLDDINPWELEQGYDPADPETAIRDGAYAGLRRIAEAALQVDSEPLLFSAWVGGENDAPKVTRDMTPATLVPARYVFDDLLDFPDGEASGMNPPVLIRLRAEALQ